MSTPATNAEFRLPLTVDLEPLAMRATYQSAIGAAWCMDRLNNEEIGYWCEYHTRRRYVIAAHRLGTVVELTGERHDPGQRATIRRVRGATASGWAYEVRPDAYDQPGHPCRSDPNATVRVTHNETRAT